MIVDAIPLWVFFIGTVAIILISIKGGFALGKHAVRHVPDEKDSPAAAVSGTVLGLVAFMLAFTFSIAAGRFDSRKALVRDDAEAIRTAWMRASFFPEPDQGEFKNLLKQYLDTRLGLAESHDMSAIPQAVEQSIAIQQKLWAIAVLHGQTDLNTDIGAMVVESVNDVTNIHAQRVAVAAEGRIPVGIWVTLYAMSVLGMVAIGFQMGMVGSIWKRIAIMLAISFAMVITLIAGLDRPQTPFVRVTQKPLEDVRALMDRPTVQVDAVPNTKP